MEKQKGISLPLVIMLIALFIAVDIGLAYYYFFVKQSKNILNNNVNVADNNLPPISAELAVAGKNLIEPNDLKLEKIEINPQIPAYSLPLDLNKVDNFKDIESKIKPSQAVLDLLQKNGFAAMDTTQDISYSNDDFASYYNSLKSKELPVFISSDSLLHYYHIFFDTTLMKLERDLFYDDTWQMTKDLYDDALAVYQQSDGDLKEAAKRNLAYLAVALELLKPQANQIVSDKTLSEEYCYEDMSEEFCADVIKGVKENYGDKSSYKYFSTQEAEKYSFSAPPEVQDLVAQEIKLITDHEGWKASPLFFYDEDYSQYVPRGHYTKSEKLKNYFKTLMWYGRMTALLNGDQAIEVGKAKCEGRFKGIISEYDAKIQTLQAGLIAQKFLADKNLQVLWQKMYAITGFFVGFSDDLGPIEYSQVLKNVLGDNFSAPDMINKFDQLQQGFNDLTYDPRIYSGLGKCELYIPDELPLSEQRLQEIKDQAKQLLSQTKGFRMMGQRFTVDSYLFSEIVSPYSGEYNGAKPALPSEDVKTFTWDDNYSPAQENRPFTWSLTPIGREVRGFPRGLDVMAIFGSKRAKEIIKELGDDQYSDYESKFSQLKQIVDTLKPEDWYQNLYWNWLYSLQGLFEPYGQGYPTFMQTQAWQDKELNSVLASWSELRHDTILYVKQSYTIAEMGAGFEPPVVGYVEPVPEFYNRLLNLTKMTKIGLEKLVPAANLEELKISSALQNFSDIITRLIEISQKELANQSLDEQEYSFINNFGKTSEDLIAIVAGGDVDPKILKSVMVADVHTDGNTEKVLEEGVGYIKTLLAAYKLPDNRILIGVGPVFSYYEFKMPMDQRLTDEKWREMLENNNFPQQPDWVKSFSK